MADQSSYPAALDNGGDLRILVPAGTTPLAFEDYLQLLGDAISKVQTELGLDPAGAQADVAARLTAIEAAESDNQTAAEVAVTPAGNISSDNVQAALEELDTEKVAKSGGWELNGTAADKTLAAYVADDESVAFGTTLTDPADAPATVDVLRDDLVLNAFPQIAQAMTDLNNLRVAYENLRASHEGLLGIVSALVAAVDTGA